ncbi:MAG: hypothetical protein LBU11_01520 [Zoogloeaceae bacterium]|jgi:hypothetical protein|nr:hypothetical protein [Zoogloeaceae bacterium]
MKPLKFLGVLLLLAAAVFLARNQGLLFGEDPLALSVDLNQFSSSMGEAEVQQILPALELKCADTKPGFSLGSRVCYANLNSFHGIEAKQIAFFFKGTKLASFKIDIPWQSHPRMLDKLHEDYGAPAHEQKELHGGVRLMSWRIKGGILSYNLIEDREVSEWNSLFWTDHKEPAAKAMMRAR